MCLLTSWIFNTLIISFRDLEEDLYPHFHRLFGMLVKQVDAVAYSGSSKSGVSNAPNPELTGKLFETLSYLIKYVIHSTLLVFFTSAFIYMPSIPLNIHLFSFPSPFPSDSFYLLLPLFPSLSLSLTISHYICLSLSLSLAASLYV